jgi:hypothetical protein
MTWQLTHEGHVDRVVVSCTEHGWDVVFEEDSVIVRPCRRPDWHRVERDVRLFHLGALVRNNEPSTTEAYEAAA